jgi:hypothetical protein
MTYNIGACRHLDYEARLTAERLCATLVRMAALEQKIDMAYGAALALACFTRPELVSALQDQDPVPGQPDPVLEIGLEEASDILESLARAMSDSLQKAIDQAFAAGLRQSDLEGNLQVTIDSTRNQIIDRLEQLLLEKITA